MKGTTPAVSMSRRRRIAYAIVVTLVALAVPFLSLLSVDIFLHSKYERSAGFNVWGYRGPVVDRKKPDEYRVVVLGGSAAFGYGTQWDEAIPAVLEQTLAGRSVGPFHQFSVVNLGYNNEGAYSFKFTLQDYVSLKYDLACLYEGYNDLMGDPRAPNLQVFRHESPVFRLTGYLPIFPIVFKEKATAILHDGDINVLYGHEPSRTTFRPGVAAKTTAEVLRAAAEVGQSLERQLGRVTTDPPRRIVDAASTGCKYPWQEYCRSTLEAVDFALQHGVQVLVVTQPHGLGPYFHERHAEQQREMANMLERRYGGNPYVRYVNLAQALDLGDPAVSYDRMHLTAAGNRRLAAEFVQPVLEMAAVRAAKVGSAQH